MGKNANVLEESKEEQILECIDLCKKIINTEDDFIKNVKIKEKWRKRTNIFLTLLIPGFFVFEWGYFWQWASSYIMPALIATGVFTVAGPVYLKLLSPMTVGTKKQNKKKMENSISFKRDIENIVDDLLVDLEEEKRNSKDIIITNKKDNDYTYVYNPNDNRERVEVSHIKSNNNCLKKILEDK